MELPNFKYHPNPVNTGAILNKRITCICCNKEREFCYAYSAYATMEIEPETICPWCISDGNAHKAFGASFVENFVSEDGGVYSGLPNDIVNEVLYRTPSYLSWQGEQWLFHCNDGCAYLGVINNKNIGLFSQGAREALYNACQISDDPKFTYECLIDSEHDQALAYLFQCLHCEKFLCHWDYC